VDCNSPYLRPGHLKSHVAGSEVGNVFWILLALADSVVGAMVLFSDGAKRINPMGDKLLQIPDGLLLILDLPMSSHFLWPSKLRGWGSASNSLSSDGAVLKDELKQDLNDSRLQWQCCHEHMLRMDPNGFETLVKNTSEGIGTHRSSL